MEETVPCRDKECRSQKARSLFCHYDQHLPRREDIVFRHWPFIELLLFPKPTKATLLAEIARCEEYMRTIGRKELA